METKDALKDFQVKMDKAEMLTDELFDDVINERIDISSKEYKQRKKERDQAIRDSRAAFKNLKEDL